MPEERLFSTGDLCKDIFVIVSGIIDIVVGEIGGTSITLDLLGRGSVIGQNYILTSEKWQYTALNRSNIPVKVLIIPWKTLDFL